METTGRFIKAPAKLTFGQSEWPPEGVSLHFLQLLPANCCIEWAAPGQPSSWPQQGGTPEQTEADAQGAKETRRRTGHPEWIREDVAGAGELGAPRLAGSGHRSQFPIWKAKGFVLPLSITEHLKLTEQSKLFLLPCTAHRNTADVNGTPLTGRDKVSAVDVSGSLE